MTFFEPGRYRVAAPSVRLLLEPAYDSIMDEQALLGEELQVLDANPEFAHVRVKYSGKTGWLAAPANKLAAIGAGALKPTHRTTRARTITFRKPDPETETMVVLPLNAQIALGERHVHNEDEFARVLGLTGNLEVWVRTSMLMPIGTYETDFVTVQERLVDTPYVWGGRDTTIGLDCSRLLGESLRATGQDYCPGDTREQVVSSWIGEEILFPPRGFGLQRGDILFWKGHIATMKDAKRCIHATDLKPYHMVIVQDLDTVIRERLARQKGPIIKVRRFGRYQRAQLSGLVA